MPPIPASSSNPTFDSYDPTKVICPGFLKYLAEELEVIPRTSRNNDSKPPLVTTDQDIEIHPEDLAFNLSHLKA